MADWHYIGHYGQLGPFDEEQMRELVESNVVERTSMVWSAGMSEWQTAESIQAFSDIFAKIPPPAPGFGQTPSTVPPKVDFDPLKTPPPFGSIPINSPQFYRLEPVYRSEKSRVLAGLINIFLPGVGRMYLGYYAIGICQFLLLFTGIGVMWAFVDGILILCGSVTKDGIGRELVK